MIRRCNKEEVKIVDELLTKLIQDERKINANINPDFKVDNWYGNFIDDDSRIILVYEIENKIAGYIYGFIEDNALFLKPVATLDALYVEEDFRKNGIANELIDEFIKWCKSKNVGSIELRVGLKNTSAMTIYAKKGFINSSLQLTKNL